MKKILNVIELELIQKKLIQNEELDTITNPTDVTRLAIQHIGRKTNEHLLIIPLNSKNHVIGINTTSIGNTNSTRVNPKTILQVCMMTNAVGVVMAHNHPSGDLTPSTADIEAYKKVSQMLNDWEIMLLDSIIVNEHDGISIREYIAGV